MENWNSIRKLKIDNSVHLNNLDFELMKVIRINYYIKNTVFYIFSLISYQIPEGFDGT